MLISHIHADHFSIEHIKALAPKTLFVTQECVDALGEEVLSSEIILIAAGETIVIDDCSVTCFEVDHGPNVTVRPKENLGFLLEVDEQKIYFAGDMFYPSGIAISELEVDVALIPVGTWYTFGPEEAVAFVKEFAHVGTVLPMHYHKNPETKAQFLSLLESTRH